jgi:hypothetical protein
VQSDTAVESTRSEPKSAKKTRRASKGVEKKKSPDGPGRGRRRGRGRPRRVHDNPGGAFMKAGAAAAALVLLASLGAVALHFFGVGGR